MKDIDVGNLIKKVDELRSLFVLGQRVLPFLEDIFKFVRDIEPMFEEINSSIKENLKRMPSASDQISKVTAASELATNEIMDIVDGLVYKISVIDSNFNRINEIADKNLNDPLKLLEIIEKAIKQGNDMQALLPQLSNSIAAIKKKSSSEQSKVLANNAEILQSIQNDLSEIMMSLQVQDITSQQLAAVNHMLSTVQNKMHDILKHFENTQLPNLSEIDQYTERTNVTVLHRPVAFDPEAIEAFNNKDFKQNEIDSIINAHNDGTLNDLIDQDNEIENNSIVEQNENNTSEVAQTPSVEVTNENASIEEIDESFSQDDIDALFGS